MTEPTLVSHKFCLFCKVKISKKQKALAKQNEETPKEISTDSLVANLLRECYNLQSVEGKNLWYCSRKCQTLHFPVIRKEAIDKVHKDIGKEEYEKINKRVKDKVDRLFYAQ
jgi:hypothetical protein